MCVSMYVCVRVLVCVCMCVCLSVLVCVCVWCLPKSHLCFNHVRVNERCKAFRLEIQL